MSKIYLSGKMTGLPNNGYELFDKNREFLTDLGFEVISPADIDRSIGINPAAPFSEERYHEIIKHDYAALLECDSIAFLNNWSDSRGARLESDFANVLKLDRYRVDSDNSYFEKELVIGLSGFAQAGKSSVASLFAAKFDFEQRGFADVLKSMLYALNPILPTSDARAGGFINGSTVRVQDYVDMYGYEESKKLSEVRQLLQRLGTNCGRKFMGADIWVETLFNTPHAARLIIPDCRFPNEYAAIKNAGGVVIRVDRPGCGAVNNHISETALTEYDGIITNTGTPDELLNELVESLSKLGVEF